MKIWRMMGVVGLAMLTGGCGVITRSLVQRGGGDHGRQWPNEPTTPLPMPAGPVTTVQNEIEAEYAVIEAEGAALLTAKKYDAIEERAKQLRASKAEWVSGYWHLSALYRGLYKAPSAGSEAGWQERVDALKEWAGKKPQSITARVALARAYNDGAWRARGDGWSSTVTGDMAKAMDERSALAAQVLEDSKVMRKQCPGWYAASLRVAQLQSLNRPAYDALFDEATATFPTYLDFHFQRLVHLLERWHGKAGQVETHMAKVADAAVPPAGDIVYAKLAWSLVEAGFISNPFQEMLIDWPRVQKGCEALLKQNPNSFAVASAYCVMAVRAGDRATAQKLFAGPVGNKVDTSVWSEKVFLKNRDWAFR